jgi:hypothetical protein
MIALSLDKKKVASIFDMSLHGFGKALQISAL